MVCTLSHEAGGVLMFGEQKTNASLFQPVDQGQDLATGNAERCAHASLMEPTGNDIGGSEATASGFGPRIGHIFVLFGGLKTRGLLCLFSQIGETVAGLW